jgi:hypothetical protein
MRNPVVEARVDRALANAQKALAEITTYGGGPPDRALALELWDQIEKMRWRVKRGR